MEACPTTVITLSGEKGKKEKRKTLAIYNLLKRKKETSSIKRKTIFPFLPSDSEQSHAFLFIVLVFYMQGCKDSNPCHSPRLPPSLTPFSWPSSPSSASPAECRCCWTRTGVTRSYRGRLCISLASLLCITLLHWHRWAQLTKQRNFHWSWLITITSKNKFCYSNC